MAMYVEGHGKRVLGQRGQDVQWCAQQPLGARDALKIWKMKSLKDKEALSRTGLIGQNVEA